MAGENISPEQPRFALALDYLALGTTALSRGWMPAITQTVGNTAVNCEVGLMRPVDDRFNSDDFTTVAETAGILDPELRRVADGYRFGLETPRRSHLMRQLGIITDPVLADTPFLIFHYEGEVTPRLLRAVNTVLLFEDVLRESNMPEPNRIQQFVGRVTNRFRH